MRASFCAVSRMLGLRFHRQVRLCKFLLSICSSGQFRALVARCPLPELQETTMSSTSISFRQLGCCTKSLLVMIDSGVKGVILIWRHINLVLVQGDDSNMFCDLFGPWLSK